MAAAPRKKADVGQHLSPPYRVQWDASILKAAEDDVAGALADLEALARQLPDEPAVHRSLANLYDRSGDGTRALTSIARAVALNPDAQSALTHVRLLLVHGPASAVGSAMSTLETAVDDDEARAEFLAYAAIVAARENKPAQAALLAARGRALDEYLSLDERLEDEFEGL
jgi:predicted Zn-dependent protease